MVKPKRQRRIGAWVCVEPGEWHHEFDHVVAVVMLAGTAQQQWELFRETATGDWDRGGELGIFALTFGELRDDWDTQQAATPWNMQSRP